MKFKQLLALTFLAPSLASASPNIAPLTGDAALACAAILCLSTGSPPNECVPPLRRYFSIDFDKMGKTIRGRINFLNLCPASNSDDNMRSLVNAIGNGAGRCDPQSLNNTNRAFRSDGDSFQIVISNKRPDYCNAYSSHEYTIVADSNDYSVYVGLPERGGHWVTKNNYPAAKSAYDKRIAEEDAKRNSMEWW